MYSANVIIPVFILILLGALSRKKGLIDSNFITRSNRVVFTLALPSSLFSMIYKTDFGSLFDPVTILITFGGTMVGFVLAWALSRGFCSSDSQRGAFVQASIRGNLAIFGMALAQRALSPETAAQGAGMLAFLIPLYNTLAVIALTSWNQTGDRKDRLKKQAVSIVTNPLMIAIVLGVFFSALKIGLPPIMETSLTYLARMTVPLALLGIGGTLSIQGLKERFIPTLGANLVKLVFIPLLIMGISVAAGIRDESLGLILILMGSPTAVSSFAMAGALNNDTDLTADIITTSTLLSLVTIGGGLALLKGLGIL